MSFSAKVKLSWEDAITLLKMCIFQNKWQCLSNISESVDLAVKLDSETIQGTLVQELIKQGLRASVPIGRKIPTSYIGALKVGKRTSHRKSRFKVPILSFIECINLDKSTSCLLLSKNIKNISQDCCETQL